MIRVNHYSTLPLNPKMILIKSTLLDIMALFLVLFHRDRFFNFCCLFRQQFSAAYLLKLFLLPQRVHTTLFIKCDKPELAHWYLSSSHAGIQMSSDEVVCSRDGCHHSIAEGTVDVPIRLFRQIFSAHTAMFSIFEHIELPAKLLDYFLQRNKSNINQSCPSA